MTDEIFFILLETDVCPKIPEKDRRYISEKIIRFKNIDSYNLSYPVLHHEWVSFGAFLRALYYLHGVQVKKLVDYCAFKLGKEEGYIKI